MLSEQNILKALALILSVALIVCFSLFLSCCNSLNENPEFSGGSEYSGEKDENDDSRDGDDSPDKSDDSGGDNDSDKPSDNPDESGDKNGDKGNDKSDGTIVLPPENF